jgi:(p)ppGpp synthase/HD superfamily hydrolase
MTPSTWSDPDWELFERAFALGVGIHRSQERKGIHVPYITHPMAVASIVMDHGGTPAEATAALLHDTAEDGGGEAVLARLEREFGDEVVRIVRGCSDSLVADRAHKAPWIERKSRHLAELRQASRSVALVTAADKLHNARSLAATLRANGDAAWAAFKAGRAGTLWLYAVTHRILEDSEAPPDLVADLGRAVGELWALAGAKLPADAPPPSSLPDSARR